MTTIDRNITITHDVMKARFDSNGKPVSDLYLWKHYRALVLENERLQAQAGINRLLDEVDYEKSINEFLAGTGRR